MCNIRNAKSCGAMRWITKEIFPYVNFIQISFTKLEQVLLVEYLICMCSNVEMHLKVLTTSQPEPSQIEDSRNCIICQAAKSLARKPIQFVKHCYYKSVNIAHTLNVLYATLGDVYSAICTC